MAKLTNDGVQLNLVGTFTESQDFLIPDKYRNKNLYILFDINDYFYMDLRRFVYKPYNWTLFYVDSVEFGVKITISNNYISMLKSVISGTYSSGWTLKGTIYAEND